MATNYVNEGCTIDIVAASDISSGDVVAVGNLLGVAVADIATGETGALSTEGVFDVPKVTGAVIAQGETVMWDSSAAKFDDNQATAAAGDISNGAIAWEAAGNGVTTVRIKLTPAGTLGALI